MQRTALQSPRGLRLNKSSAGVCCLHLHRCTFPRLFCTLAECWEHSVEAEPIHMPTFPRSSEAARHQPFMYTCTHSFPRFCCCNTSAERFHSSCCLHVSICTSAFISITSTVREIQVKSSPVKGLSKCVTDSVTRLADCSGVGNLDSGATGPYHRRPRELRLA